MHPFRHLHTVNKHRFLVMIHCFRAGLIRQGLCHDLSKYSPTEFLAGARYFQGIRSPNDGEREKNGYSLAWMHHKGRNKHHIEYWTDYDPKTHKIEAVQMPRKYVAEMFCDRVAACKTYQKSAYTNGSALEYFLKGKPRRWGHPQTSADIEMLLTMLRDKGEDETFLYLKKWVKEG